MVKKANAVWQAFCQGVSYPDCRGQRFANTHKRVLKQKGLGLCLTGLEERLQGKAERKPKTLQYLMGHSDIGVTLNTYTHLEDAAEELHRMEDAKAARREQEKLAGKAKDAQKLFKAV